LNSHRQAERISQVCAVAGFTPKIEMEPEMTKTLAGCCGALLVVSLQIFPAGFSAANAEPARPGDEESVTVDGPYTVRQEVARHSLSSLGTEQTISVSQNVSYADLDMSKQTDVDTLRGRVRSAAKDSCRQLERRFPNVLDRDLHQCIRDATRNGLADVNAIASRSLARANSGQTVARADVPPVAQ
jgi:UrcA family protein